RHLLLERTLRVHQAEQPALARVRDVRGRTERTVDRHPDEAGLSDELVDLVGRGVVVDQAIQRGGVAELGVLLDVSGRGAEADATQQMFDEGLASGHRRIRQPSPRQVKPVCGLQNASETVELVPLRRLAQKLPEEYPRPQPGSSRTVAAA